MTDDDWHERLRVIRDRLADQELNEAYGTRDKNTDGDAGSDTTWPAR